MKANEIRVGNLLYLVCDGHHHEPDEVIWSTEDFEFYQCRMDDIQPIPLTEEWLECFGFERNLNDDLTKGQLTLQVSVNGNWFRVLDEMRLDGIEIKHVNQLQNLYFALTGQELTLIK